MNLIDTNTSSKKEKSKKKGFTLSNSDKALLYNYLGQGFYDKPVTIFGNEPGLSDVNGLSDMISKIRDGQAILNLSNAFLKDGKSVPFLLEDSFANPTLSEFARFSARLDLAIITGEDRFFGELSELGKVSINNYIVSTQSTKYSSLLNLRPLPRAKQDSWVYDNIDKRDYNKEWNFTLKSHKNANMTRDGQIRRDALEVALLKKYTNNLTIGVGEKENKKAFIEKCNTYTGNFQKVDLNTHSIYYHPIHKIVLSNYFNSRNGIKLTGLKELYNFLKTNKLI